MISSRVTSVVGLLTILGVSGYGAQVTGQGALAVGGAVANFGVRSLAPGFMPDPINISVVSGGAINARTLGLGAGCVGFVSRTPDLILRLTGNSPSLRVYMTVPGARAVSPTDTTLLVNTARGGWRCNDDSFGSANPTVELPGSTPGQYDIWVGAYQAGTQARGVLHVTELASNHP